MDAGIPTDAGDYEIKRRFEVNALLDAILVENGLREYELVKRFYEQKARAMLLDLLHDVASTPDEFIAFCQELLQPKPAE